MSRHLILHILFLLCFVQRSIAQTSETVYNTDSGVSHWIVSDILQDSKGFIWFSTWNGLNRFDGYEFRQVKSYPGDGADIRSEVIRQMALDEAGNIICITEDGAFKLDARTYRLTSDFDLSKCGIKQNTCTVSFRDREGNLWHVGRYGVTKTSSAEHPAQLVEGTEGVQARAFLLDKGSRLWLATKEDECIRLYNRGRRLVGYLGRDGRFHRERTSFGYRAYSMMQARNGDIWIGCKPGALLRLRSRHDGTYEIKEFGKEGLPCNVIYHIVDDSAGRLWFATFGGGVACIEYPALEEPSFVTFPMKGIADGKVKVRRIYPTRSGNIVCATTNGLVLGIVDRKDLRKTVFRRLVRNGKDEGSLAGNALMDVVGDKAGRIFIATENNGIDVTDEKTLFSEKPSFRHYNTANSSLTSDACHALALKDDGRLLIVSTDRVMDFSPEKDETVTYSSTFWNDESHFSEERPLQLSPDSWLFGQEQGAYIATRRSMDVPGYVPPLLFTELAVNGKRSRLDVCNTDTIIIDTDERNFSLSFATLDYTDNSEILYRTRLDSAPWSHASKDRSLAFYDLQPREHILEVQSTDRYGRWVKNTRRLLIVVKPHWYETLWARFFGWLTVMAMITGAVYTVFHVRELHRQRRELLEKYMALLDKSAGSDGNTSVKEIGEELPSGIPAADRKFLDRVKEYIEENISNSDANIDDMASFAATSRSNLNRKLRSLVGITAAQLLIDARMQRAAQLLGGVDGGEKLSVSEVAYRCGYSDSRYFARCFKQKYGVTPSGFSAESEKE
ncbi:AraC family transcriptional regulator [Prevotella sp. PINT]|uniref:AraC family transcriptional regulator n=1 Tax=Palleniella intestinalis TaxID=2736291 RepID=UPI0015540D3E|nr:two-component regulator propeller domain-containing protein [Palleniella intestinalis]NPD83093.1 AraC family transcriptional regulator [Palleniella intestinalis]